ncbi:MAG: G patch domain-containing protein, partial [Thaumarchaeota archaeon]|nr:G patch domain-containing protein [Nitrososphaerota archaeon]
GSSSESSSDEDDFPPPSVGPGADEFADYNPRKRRRTGRDAKESAALGIFGSESEDEGPGKRWKRKSNLRGKVMAFVSTGQKKMNEDEDEDEDEEEEEDEDENMEDEQEDAGEVESMSGLRAGLGMGLGASKGLGWSPASKTETTNVKFGTPLGKGFVPSSAAVPILRNTEDEEISTPRTAMPSAFSTPASGKGRDRQAQGGTTMNAGSFAARMMAKMGYKEGQGLGKEGQGRSGVIEVQLRPQGVGLGAVREKSKQEKEEEKRQAKLRGEAYEDSDEERKKKKKKARTPGDSAKGSGASTPRRITKPKYRTVAEVEKAAPGLKIPDAFAPILDM